MGYAIDGKDRILSRLECRFSKLSTTECHPKSTKNVTLYNIYNNNIDSYNSSELKPSASVPIQSEETDDFIKLRKSLQWENIDYGLQQSLSSQYTLQEFLIVGDRLTMRSQTNTPIANIGSYLSKCLYGVHQDLARRPKYPTFSSLSNGSVEKIDKNNKKHNKWI